MERILIANRGEIVIRVAKTCRKLGYSPCGIYSDADKDSLHIKHCDSVENIGGNLPDESYLNMMKIIDAARKMDCTFIHPGYGFLAEKSEFANLCNKEGLVFIGPSADVLKISGDKVLAKEILSNVANTIKGKEVSDINEALEYAEELGYPVIIKAARGGGGRGLQVINTPQELTKLLKFSIREALLSFGSGRVYLEKYVQNPRHIEVQILGDRSKVIHLGERECTIQRRHQKLIEETPSPALDDVARERLVKTAIKIMEKIRYDNAGTVEFLLKDGSFYFMEINSRIQVEHPITEAVTGIDIAEQQLNISCRNGMTLEQNDLKASGHAIECRINAEHPISFTPYPGLVTNFAPPIDSRSIRIDSSLYTGYSIPPFYDSLIAKLIVRADNREKAIEKMKNALLDFRISGIPSTIPFQLSALNDDRFLKGNYDTSFVEKMKPYSEKNGEIAAIIFENILKRRESPGKYIKENETDQENEQGQPWILSRYEEFLKLQGNYDLENSMRWTK